MRKLEAFQIRPARWEDVPLVAALEARVQPYRPEDEAEVEAMYGRALQAEQSHDVRWQPIPVSSPPPVPSETDPFPDMDTFWVATSGEASDAFLMGSVGIQTFRAGDVIGFGHPLVAEWKQRGRVVELRRLRVAPEARRRGLGTRLSQTVIEWARTQRYDLLVVNTTTPQLPARRLYAGLGFHEKGISFIGRYELVWMELTL